MRKKECDYCGKKINLKESIKYQDNFFCRQRCLEAFKIVIKHLNVSKEQKIKLKTQTYI